MNRINFFIILLALITILASCAEDVAPGEKGSQGETGAANVMYSDRFTITQSDF